MMEGRALNRKTASSSPCLHSDPGSESLIVPTSLRPLRLSSWDMDKKEACLPWLCWSPASEVWLPWRWAPWKLTARAFPGWPWTPAHLLMHCLSWPQHPEEMPRVTLLSESSPLHLGRGKRVPKVREVVIPACRVPWVAPGSHIELRT